MTPEAQQKLNTILNVFLAVLLLVAMIYIGVYGGKYLKYRLSEQSTNQGIRATESERQAKAIWGIAMVIFAVVAIVFVMSKISKKSSLQ